MDETRMMEQIDQVEKKFGPAEITKLAVGGAIATAVIGGIVAGLIFKRKKGKATNTNTIENADFVDVTED